MLFFLLKLTLAPALIGLTSLAGRKWGPAVSGLIVGLPLTTGPVIFLLALQNGADFAAHAAAGTLSGGIALITFTLVYAWLATRFSWIIAASGSVIFFLVLTAGLQLITFPLYPLLGGLLIYLLLGLKLMPRPAAKPDEVATPLPAWDLPARMILAMGIVFVLTGLGPVLGAKLTGLLATLPVYTTILAAFAHYLQGADAAIHVLRGLVLGLFSFLGFYMALTLALIPLGIGTAFGLAIMLALLAQGGAWIFLRARS